MEQTLGALVTLRDGLCVSPKIAEIFEKSANHLQSAWDMEGFWDRCGQSQRINLRLRIAPIDIADTNLPSVLDFTVRVKPLENNDFSASRTVGR